MIGLGINTHSIGASLSEGVPIVLQDVFRKVCITGQITPVVSLNGQVARTVSISGTIQKTVNFSVTLKLDC